MSTLQNIVRVRTPRHSFWNANAKYLPVPWGIGNIGRNAVLILFTNTRYYCKVEKCITNVFIIHLRFVYTCLPMNQCWNIVNWTLRNKLKCNFNRNSYIFIQENPLENVVWKIAAIMSRPQCVNTLVSRYPRDYNLVVSWIWWSMPL